MGCLCGLSALYYQLISAAFRIADGLAPGMELPEDLVVPVVLGHARNDVIMVVVQFPDIYFLPHAIPFCRVPRLVDVL